MSQLFVRVQRTALRWAGISIVGASVAQFAGCEFAGATIGFNALGPNVQFGIIPEQPVPWTPILFDQGEVILIQDDTSQRLGFDVLLD